MTEKRFWYDFEDCTGAKIVDFKEDKEYPLKTIGDFRAIEELLNMLHEENQQSRCRIQYLETKINRERNATSKQHLKWSDEAEEQITELEKENEQLKDALNQRTDQCDNYYKENEQLKKQNTFLTEQLAELSSYIMALGYDVELHFEDGRIIKLNEEVVEK